MDGLRFCRRYIGVGGRPGGSFNQTAAPCARLTARAGSGRTVRPRDRCGVRRRGVRGGRRPAVAVVRRGGDDLGVDTIGARTVAADPQHRCRARPVLPRHARLVRDLPRDRILVAAVQLPGRRDRRGGRCRCGQTVFDAHGRGLCWHRFRDPSARHVGRNRGQVLRADGSGGRLVDRVGRSRRPRQEHGGAVAAVRVGLGGVDAAQRVRRADGVGACGRGARGGEEAVRRWSGGLSHRPWPWRSSRRSWRSAGPRSPRSDGFRRFIWARSSRSCRSSTSTTVSRSRSWRAWSWPPRWCCGGRGNPPTGYSRSSRWHGSRFRPRCCCCTRWRCNRSTIRATSATPRPQWPCCWRCAS